MSILFRNLFFIGLLCSGLGFGLSFLTPHGTLPVTKVADERDTGTIVKKSWAQIKITSGQSLPENSLNQNEKPSIFKAFPGQSFSQNPLLYISLIFALIGFITALIPGEKFKYYRLSFLGCLLSIGAFYNQGLGITAIVLFLVAFIRKYFHEYLEEILY